MKKYFSFLLPLSFLFVLVISFSILSQDAKAAVNTCTKDSIFNEDGTPCTLIASCTPGEKIDFRTGKECAVATAVVTTSTSGKSLENFLIDSMQPIKYGEQSLDVAILQAFLAEQGLLSQKNIIGRSGPATASAVKAFQKVNKLKVDGVVGSRTLSKFKEIAKRDLQSTAKIVKKARSVPVKSAPKSSQKPEAIEEDSEPQCQDPYPGTKTRTYDLAMTVDNYFGAYVRNKVTDKLDFLYQDIGTLNNNYILDTQMPWASTEKFPVTLSKDEVLGVWTINDTRVDDGFVLSATFTDETGAVQTSVSSDKTFKVMRTEAIKPNSSVGFFVDDKPQLLSEIKNGVWSKPTIMGQNGIAPWGSMSGIASYANWLAHLAGVRDKTNYMTVYETEYTGDGALPPCEPPVNPPATCPEGTTGTPPNCTPIVTPAPTMCVSWADVAVYGDDTLEYKITYPSNITIDNKGSNSNIELIIDPTDSTKPNITAVLDGSDTKTLHFVAFPGSGFTYDAGAHIGQATLNFKNGATIKIGGVNVNTSLGALTSECVQVISGSVNYRATPLPGEPQASRFVDYSITFNRPVVVTGTPTMKVKNVNGAQNVVANYLSGSGTSKITFHASYLLDDPASPFWPTDYEGTGVIYLNGGTIKDLNDHNMNLTVPSSVIFDSPY